LTVPVIVVGLPAGQARFTLHSPMQPGICTAILCGPVAASGPAPPFSIDDCTLAQPPATGRAKNQATPKRRDSFDMMNSFLY
jgi:hypothetical protein